MKAYNTIYEGGTDEIVEKKSRFIAQVFPVETEEEVAKKRSLPFPLMRPGEMRIPERFFLY